MSKKQLLTFTIIFFIITVFITTLFLYLNYRSYTNIDVRSNYSSFYDTCWFYHPLINFLNGRGWTSEAFLHYKHSNHLFGTHSFFFLYLYAIIIYFIRLPLVLFLSTPLFYGFAALYLFKIIKINHLNLNFSILVSLFFFLNPQFYWSLWHGFYLVNIAAFLLIPFFYYLHLNRLVKSFIFGLLVALCQEFMAIIVGILFLIWIFYTKSKKDKKNLIIFSLFFLLYFVFNYLYLIPSYSNFQSNHEIKLFYGYLGASFREIVKNFFFHFNKVIEVLFVREKIFYVMIMFGSYIFFSLFTPLVIAAFPLLSIALFSVFSSLYDLRVSYSTPINVVLFISAIFFILRHKTLKIFNNIIFIILTASLLLIFYYKFSPSIFSRQFKSIYNCSELTERKIYVKELIKKYNNIDVKKAAVTDIYSIYFADYPVLYPFPHFYEEADLLFIDTKFLRNNQEKQVISDLLDSGNYNLKEYKIDEKSILILTKKDYLE